MLIRSFVVALIAVSLVPWEGGAFARGGGGHVSTTVTVIGGVRDEPLFRGEAAQEKLEISGAPSVVEGDMRIGDVIARHVVRADDAIVLLDPVKGRRRDIPAGTALARVHFAVSGHREVVWCDVRPTDRVLWGQEHDCLEDATNSGRLDRLWEGDSLVHFLGFMQSGIDVYGDAMAAPANYRRATPDERPRGVLGFKYCDGDGISSPPRFALVIANTTDTGWPLTGACRFGTWPDPNDHSKVDTGAMVLSVTPAAPGVLHFRVLRPAPLGTVVPTIPNEPLIQPPDDAHVTPPPIARPQAMFTMTGKPTVHWGPIGVGDTLASGPVRHALTGTLRNRVRPTGLFAPRDQALEIGQPMFGIPTASGASDGIIWCAPQRIAGVFHARCLAPVQAGYVWMVERTPALAPSSIGALSGEYGASSAPTIELGPIELPPITLSIKLAAVTLDKAGVPAPIYHLETYVDWGEGPLLAGRSTFEAAPSGHRLGLLGLVVRAKPAQGDKMTIEPWTLVP